MGWCVSGNADGVLVKVFLDILTAFKAVFFMTFWGGLSGFSDFKVKIAQKGDGLRRVASG